MHIGQHQKTVSRIGRSTSLFSWETFPLDSLLHVCPVALEDLEAKVPMKKNSNKISNKIPQAVKKHGGKSWKHHEVEKTSDKAWD